MSDLLSPLVAELKTRIAAVWTDVVHAGTDGQPASWLYEVEHAQQIAFQDIRLPAAYLLLGEEQPAAWGMDNFTHTVLVEVYYVGEALGPAGLATIRARVRALSTSLWTTDLTSGQVIEEPRASANARLAVNMLFFERKAPLRAGRVVCPVLIGERI